MIKALLTTSAILILTAFSVQAQTVATQQPLAAQVSEITKLRAANAAMRQALIAAQFEQLKRNFDEAVAKAKSDFQAAGTALKEATDAAFKEANVSADAFDFNPMAGEFTAKPKPSPEEAPKAQTVK